jgi:hypothetical protein
VGERDQFTLSGEICSDILEPDVSQSGVGQRRHDLGRVVDGPVVVGEHENEVSHYFSLSAFGVGHD